MRTGSQQPTTKYSASNFEAMRQEATKAITRLVHGPSAHELAGGEAPQVMAMSAGHGL